MQKQTLKNLHFENPPIGTKFNFEDTLYGLKNLVSLTENAHGGYTLSYLKWDATRETIVTVVAEISDDHGVYLPTQTELEEWYEERRHKAELKMEARKAAAKANKRTTATTANRAAAARTASSRRKANPSIRNKDKRILAAQAAQ